MELEFDMKKLLKGINAFVGFAGSSENPQKMSMRMMGVFMGVVSQFMPLIAMAVEKFVELPPGMSAEMFVTNFTSSVEPVILLIAVVIWLIGAFRAAWSAFNVQERVGAFLR